MSGYGIKLVWARWHDENVVGFSDRAKKKWEDDIEPGIRMLIYETSIKRPGNTKRGVKAIVGEVEVTGTWEQGAGKATPTQEHDNPVDVRVLRYRADISPIPLRRVREIIRDASFPHQGQAWRPLSQEQYRALLAEWD